MTTIDREQLRRLAKPFPDDVIASAPKGGGDYVPHAVVNQALLYILGAFDFQLVEVHRGDVLDRQDRQFVDGKSELLLHNVIVAATYRLTCEIDGRRTVIEATGDVGNPTNWQHDGARLKDAESDALKRCASRIGLGLHLWSKGHYGLHSWLSAATQHPQHPQHPQDRQDRQDDGQPSEASSSDAPEGGETSPSPPSGSNGQPDFVVDVPKIATVDEAKAYIKQQDTDWQVEFRHQADSAKEHGTLAGLSPLEQWVQLIKRTWAQRGIATRMAESEAA
jgi:hypothetical protein